MTRLVVKLPADCAELPARAYLIRHYGISNSQWKRLKHTGDFRKNGFSANATHTMVQNGDILPFESEKPPRPDAFPIEPQDLPIDIRYEDDFLLAVNKPAGQLVHPLTVEPTGTLANAVLGYYRRKGEAHHFHPLHRLDRQTTGLVLIAKEPQIQHMLTKSGEKRFHRIYLAIARGTLPQPAGIIDKPLGRSDGSFIRQEVRATSAGGKEARTRYEVLAARGDLSLVRLALETGRTHQIRVHLASLGCPLLGDDLYGTSDARIARQALHAAQLSFRHPITHADCRINAPLPPDMQTIITSSFPFASI